MNGSPLFTEPSRCDGEDPTVMEKNLNRIPVGISACLTGQEVRHDGGHKHSAYCSRTLSRYFEFRPLCPEAGAGLGVPRPAMHLREDAGVLRLVTVREGEDRTAELNAWIDRTLAGLQGLRGFILTPKSPSCGLERIRLYDEQGNVRRRDGTGLFAAALRQRYPLMPLEEAGRLNDEGLRENFIERVFLLDDWMNMRSSGLTPAKLIDFHTRHKFQLLAHCQSTCRRLGPLLADLRAAPLEEIAETWIHEVMQAMAKRVSRGDHVNAMQHLAGFVRGQLDVEERRVLDEQIHAYLRGEVPLVVPMTLLRMAQRRQPVAYLEKQQYLRPYPDALGLRNAL